MANSKPLSAIEVEILKSAIQREIRDKKIPKDQWPAQASLFIQTYTGASTVDAKLLDWILRK